MADNGLEEIPEGMFYSTLTFFLSCCMWCVVFVIVAAAKKKFFHYQREGRGGNDAHNEDYSNDGIIQHQMASTETKRDIEFESEKNFP